MKAIERVYQYIAKKGIKVVEFERISSLSNGYLAKMKQRNGDLGESILISILENSPDISPTWLLTGEGSMLRSDCHLDSDKTGTTQGDCRETVAAQKLTNSDQKTIPLVTTAAAAGFGSPDFAIREQDVEGYYLVPAFKHLHIDFMMHVTGDSMVPRYYSGDIVACTVLRDHNVLQWNKPHIIATRYQGILCKRIMPSSNVGYIQCVSDNAAYPPFDIPMSEITAMALICGTIRLD